MSSQLGGKEAVSVEQEKVLASPPVEQEAVLAPPPVEQEGEPAPPGSPAVEQEEEPVPLEVQEEVPAAALPAAQYVTPACQKTAEKPGQVVDDFLYNKVVKENHLLNTYI